LAQEIALLADRLDVSEEISRFHSHLEAFRSAVKSPGADGVGKWKFTTREFTSSALGTMSRFRDRRQMKSGRRTRGDDARRVGRRIPALRKSCGGGEARAPLDEGYP